MKKEKQDQSKLCQASSTFRGKNIFLILIFRALKIISQQKICNNIHILKTEKK